MNRVLGLYALGADSFGQIYGPDQRRAVDLCMHQVAPPQTSESLAKHPELLADVEVLMTGWGAPVVDEAFLSAAPKLKAIFYGSGAVGGWATEALWERDILVTTASVANGISVAEYTLAMILLGLKQVLPLARRRNQELGSWISDYIPGTFRRTVGLISFGVIARRLCELLRSSDLDVIVYDPFISQAEASAAGVKLVGLDEVFQRSEVVSVHTPLLPETVGLVTGKQLSLMRRNAVFINTARGAIVCQDELITVARQRHDIQYILDVTTPEPLPFDSELYDLPNVLITPHVAGSVAQECQRMGQYMADELQRYVNGQPLHWQVKSASVKNSVHRPQRRTEQRQALTI